MSQIIADSYEILQQIGSGGGGVVYLGRHLRLGKLVVLKADRRDLTARPEVLRREVDALKNLSHTYIPQVYDFVAENGVVYTVMDYIEGESLDKPLKRGERFSQAQVIKWACQLLEALCYLHSRPPHGILHSDIKPSNLMLTPQGDIRLIDFNIALALGEEGAVRVGFSRGYASPEHYGIDYSGLGATQGVRDEAATRMEEDPATVVSTGAGSSSTGRRTVLLDVRSRQEFQKGHIPGSRNVPLSSLGEAAGLAEDKETPLFVYCYSGARSGQAVHVLRRMGYANVKNIGGIAAWTGEVER